jgi:uncharacterized membrane protein
MSTDDRHWRRHLRNAAIAGGFIGYSILAYFVASSPPTAHLGIVAFAVLPLVAAIVMAAWQTRLRIAAIALIVAAGVALWMYSDVLGRNLGLVYLAQENCANAALAFLFGRTLFGGHEPLCTRLARMLRGTLEPRVERYTRWVTVAWTTFFIVMLAVSIALYVVAPIHVWSAFANLLTLPLIALMFVVEYAIRMRLFRDLPHKPILDALRAYLNSPRPSTTPPR